MERTFWYGKNLRHVHSLLCWFAFLVVKQGVVKVPRKLLHCKRIGAQSRAIRI